MKPAASVSGFFIISTLMYFLKGIKATNMRSGTFILSKEKELQMETLFDIKSFSAIACGSLCLSNDECEAYAFDSTTKKCLGFSAHCQSKVTSLASTAEFFQRQEGNLHVCRSSLPSKEVTMTTEVNHIVTQNDTKEGKGCMRSAIGWDYKGTTNVTQSGKVCQRWESDTPHSHHNHEFNNQENYCRNSQTHEQGMPFCYTTDPGTPWEYCNISICVPGLQNTSCFTSSRGEYYFGTVNTTEYGVTCQRWDAHSPHNHSYGYLYDQENYCRNPFAVEQRTWCYTTDPDKTWDFCPVPECETKGEDCMRSAKGWDYKGTTNVTKSGRICQRWYSNTPHSHNYHRLNGQENYCRNYYPDDEDMPWCFTTDPDTPWEYCNISICELENPSCFATSRGEDYFGTARTTDYGVTCQRWDSQSPHNHFFGYLYDQENYCRNPFGKEERPWCYTTDSNTRWDYCPVPECDPSIWMK